MPLRDFMTATATTQRLPAIVSGKRGDPVTHLQNVKVTPVMLLSAQSSYEVRRAIGIEGANVQLWESYTESHEHTDGESTVTQMPDIQNGDRLLIGGVTYVVRWTEQNPATFSTYATRIMYLVEDRT